MTQDRLSELLAAYGADPARWPDDARDAAGEAARARAAAPTSDEAASMRDARGEAAKLDALLALVDERPAVSAQVRDRVLADAAALTTAPDARPAPEQAAPGAVGAGVLGWLVKDGLRGRTATLGATLAASLLVGAFIGYASGVSAVEESTVAFLEVGFERDDLVWVDEG